MVGHCTSWEGCAVEEAAFFLTSRKQNKREEWLGLQYLMQGYPSYDQTSTRFHLPVAPWAEDRVFNILTDSPDSNHRHSFQPSSGSFSPLSTSLSSCDFKWSHLQIWRDAMARSQWGAEIPLWKSLSDLIICLAFLHCHYCKSTLSSAFIEI